MDLCINSPSDVKNVSAVIARKSTHTLPHCVTVRSWNPWSTQPLHNIITILHKHLHHRVEVFRYSCIYICAYIHIPRSCKAFITWKLRRSKIVFLNKRFPCDSYLSSRWCASNCHTWLLSFFEGWMRLHTLTGQCTTQHQCIVLIQCSTANLQCFLACTLSIS